MTQTTTIKAGDSAKTITLDEGQSLTIVGGNGAVGMAYLLDAIQGGLSPVKSWPIGTGALPSPIGPFANTQLVHITCQVGQISATTQDAVLTVNGAVAAVVTGTGIVGDKLTATLPTGVVGTLQFTKTLKASPFTKSNIAGAAANAVNSLQYTVLLADVPYNFGCDSSNTVSPSNTIAAVATSAGGDTATALTLTGPTTGTVGAASAAYIVALSPNGGTVASPVTVTPIPVTGVTFSPATLTLSTGLPSGTFTVTATTSGTKTIGVTNDGGLTAPATIALVVAASGTAPTITSAPVIIGTPTVGVSAAATAGVYTGSPTPTVTRQWLVAGVVVATAANYTPVTADAAKVLTVRETVSNTAGTVVSNSSGVTIAAAVTALRNSATLMGDSWMAYGNPNSTGETSLSYIGWMNDILRKNGAVGLDGVNLRAVGGTNIQNHLASQVPLALGDDNDIVWYHGGVNSFNPTGGTFTLAQNNTAMASIISQLAAAKKLVIVSSVNPVWQTGSTGSAPRAGEFPAFNAATKAECDKYPNVYFHDQYSLLVDPASTTDHNPLPDLIQPVDGIHPLTNGSRLIGEDAATKVGPLIAAAVKYKTRGANLLSAFTGGGGTSTPGPGPGTINGTANIPANWDVGVASGINVITVSDSPTNAGYKRFVITNGATSTASTANISLNTAGQSALLALLSIGDVVQGGFDYKIIGTSSKLTRVAATLRLGGAVSGVSWDAMQRTVAYEADAVLKYNQTSSEGRRYFHPYTITTLGTTPQAEFIISINLGVPTSGTVTIDIAVPDLFKLT